MLEEQPAQDLETGDEKPPLQASEDEAAPGDGEEGEEAEEGAGEGEAAAGDDAGAGAGDGDPNEASDEEAQVDEHLKDAVEGSLRLKRMLSQDSEENPSAAKRPRTTAAQSKVEQLLVKWQLLDDALVRHVLECLELDELSGLLESGYILERFSPWKSACELLAKYTAEVRERKLVGGGPLDVVASFRFRWKLSAEQDKLLRGLNHKELRYCLNNYDGTTSLEECVSRAAAYVPEDDTVTECAVPDAPGLLAVGRYTRMEIIDPTADCAVFGDANLTFSVNLARHRKGIGHVGRVIATTFEELPTLRERYKEIDRTIQVLEEHFAEVYHGVDCTRIALDTRLANLANSLGAVYYNFPHSGAIQGFFDGHPVVNWRHENLMRLFFRALRSFVLPGGSVKVASNMAALGVRYSYIMYAAIENEFYHVETVPFLEWNLHRYGRSYGDRRDAYKRPDAAKNESYNSQRAEADMLYCFVYRPSGEPLPAQQVRPPPPLKSLMSCPDGPFKNLRPDARHRLAKDLHKRFVKEISGIHVG
eukprot:TRINITY_DN531_c0_g2_i4.p1 TRINITY_DN531_c0_g2~~TRINITY_DN531_c0_g2_i4.p1  ORF type:complete len:533 (-),score=147.33 TRINITY_DN531_c0_g2_i4:109-1707(-)